MSENELEPGSPHRRTTPGSDTRALVEQARRAYRSWATRTGSSRTDFLRPLRSLIARNGGRLVHAVDEARAREPGETLAAEVLPLAAGCRYLERNATRILRDRHTRPRLFPIWLSRIDLRVRREPHGVVLIIGPSNYPLFLPGVQLLQALVAGNAVVVKPGRNGSAAIGVLADLLQEAGLPRGLCHVLDEAPESARSSIAAGVDKVVLTGSVATGRAVLRDLAETVTPATLELSGCDAVFVLGDADLGMVARAVAFGLRLNAGATCIAPHRLFVPEALASELTEVLVERVKAIGACEVNREVADRAAALMREAVSEGARLLAGSLPPAAPFRPVVLGDVRPAMKIARADLFCPVLSVMTVRDMEQALAFDAECPYALGASVFGDPRRARRLAERIRAGTVVVNDIIAPTAHPSAPFGGRDLSGYGTTRGAEGLLEMTRPKAILVRGGRLRPHLRPPGELDSRVFQDLLEAGHAEGLRQRLSARFRALRRMIKSR